MGKFSDLTDIERNILLEYIQSGVIPSDFDGEKYDRLNLIMKKLSTTRRSRFPGKNSIDVLVEEDTSASKLVDDIIDGIPDKSGTLLLIISSLQIKAILKENGEILGLQSYISSVTIDGESQKIYVYAISGKDGTYYVIDNDTDPKTTLYTQDDADLGTPIGNYTGSSGRLGTATIISNEPKGK
jgi:hypothetical protein